MSCQNMRSCQVREYLPFPPLPSSLPHPVDDLVRPNVLEHDQARAGDAQAARRGGHSRAHHRFCRRVRAPGDEQRAMVIDRRLRVLYCMICAGIDRGLAEGDTYIY